MAQNPNDPNAHRIQSGTPRPSGPARPAREADPEPFRFDQDEPGGEVVRVRQRSWLDDQFGGTSVVVLVLFAFCCGMIAFAFGLAGVIGCKTPQAKQNALIVLCVSSAMIAISFMAQFAEVVLEAMKK